LKAPDRAPSSVAPARHVSPRRALAFSFLDRYAGLLIAIVSSMIIARLLTPAEIGVFSVTMVLLSFISTLRDMGAGQYLLQEKELTPERIRATWTVQLGLGIAFSLIVLAAAYPVAVFYKDPRMVNLMMVLALNFAISPFGSLTYAWLMREMRFDALAVMRFGGSMTGACISVAMAWRGFGPISLAFGSFTATVANAALAIFFRPREFPWMPGLAEVPRVLRFGGKVSLTSVMTTFGLSVPELVLGKAQGMSAVGMYSRANGLASMFNRLILDATQSVAMPLFSKALRDGNSLGPIFMKATSYVTVIGWTFFGVMIVLAEPLVRVLYGDQWDASVPLARQIAGAMAIGLPAVFCSTALMAGGDVDALVRITLLTTLQYAALLAVGATFGLEQLGWTIVLASVISVGIWLSQSPVTNQVSKPELLTMLLHSASIAVCATLASGIALRLAADAALPNFARVALGAGAAAVAFVAGTFAFRHPVRAEFRQLRTKGSAR
jgi:O-antigen/teichoic acid export membrane protein